MNLLVTKNFNGIKLDCYKAEDGSDDFWATREQIGRLLGYKDPIDSIKKIHKRNRERLEKFSRKVELRKYFNEGQIVPPFKNEPITTVYNFRGLLEICRWSNQLKANAVIDFLWDVADDIRKHGMYISDKVQDTFKSNHDAFDVLVKKYVAEKEKVRELQEQIDKDMQYTNVGKIVLALPGSITFADAAKLFAQHGFDIGRNRLLKLCREMNLLCEQKCQKNRPTQKGIKKGIVNIEIDLSGGVRFTTRPMLTPDGVKEMYRVLQALQRPLELLFSEKEQGETD
ncbi:MAG: hypothetical protein IJQ99_00625 [Synergistaceae bacterium]|nr:hypothetical protein [Synergistaceae bacterium]MBR0315359.1 hypothetical protein [Synergistaceae bacterium]